MRITSAPQPSSTLVARPQAAPPTAADPADTLSLDSQQRSEQASAAYHKELALKGGQRAVFGGALGWALLSQAYNMPHANLLGPVLGAGIGFYTAWESLHREKTGKATFEVDGQTYKKPLVGDIKHVPLSPQEARFELLAKGSPAPDAVKNHQSRKGEVSQPSPEQLAPWKDQSAQFRQLADQRRLVADFGQKTQDGHTALNLVDGLTAARMAATGGQVYQVNAKQPQDVQHTMSVLAFNGAHTQGNSEDYTYLERAVDYTLRPIKNPADLSNLAAAHGVPEGMLGLVAGEQHHGEVINFGEQAARGETYSPEFGTGATRTHDSSDYSTTTRDVNRPVQVDSRLTTGQHVNLPALLGMAGAAAGMIAAMSFTGPGVPGPALIGGVVGFLGGRVAGRALIGDSI